MRIVTIVIAVLLLSVNVKASTCIDTSKKAKGLSAQQYPAILHTSFNHHLSLQLEAGSQGAGADLRFGLTSKFSLRAGGNFAPVSFNGNFGISGFQTNYAVSSSYANFHLLGDVAPFKSLQGLRLVFGGAYLYKANTGFTASISGEHVVGNYAITGADIGILNINVTQKGAAPYLGFGLLKSFPNHVFNFNADIGTYYLTAPQSSITGTNLLADNYKLAPSINENIKNYRWLPVLQLNFNFKLK